MQAKIIYLDGSEVVKSVPESWFGHAPDVIFSEGEKNFSFSGVTKIQRDTFQVFTEH